ncbi:uncharacterized protein B0H64DRAFT_441535 [Chaetomium fimeti]|uniref:Uncharacterized protein n=1 Tax=Chaetomium fimeti TaxID=1854472 RepID=A0AAE0HEW2_9PEZI|nr:hypothetical protein B0H64DRAFT_441535 [Chaetomium fimeti]
MDNQVTPIDQHATRLFHNTLSFLGFPVNTAIYFSNNAAECNHHDGIEGHGCLSCPYIDSYDADDELLEESNDEWESSDIYFEDADSPFSTRPAVRSPIMGAPLSPLLMENITTLGELTLSGDSSPTSRDIHDGFSTQSTSASIPPAALPWTVHPLHLPAGGPNRDDPSPSPAATITIPNHFQPIPSSLPPASSSPLPTAPTPTLLILFDTLNPPTSPTPPSITLSPPSPPHFPTTSTNTTTSYQSDALTYYSDDSAYDEASSVSSVSDGKEGGVGVGVGVGAGGGWGRWRGVAAAEVSLAVVLVEQELGSLGEGVWRGLMGVDTDEEGGSDGGFSGESDGGSDWGSD